MFDLQIDLVDFVVAAGALGTAAMGIVEGFKSIRITPFGFSKLRENITWSNKALGNAYGDQVDELLKSLYRLGRSGGELPRILRQGVRIGLDKDNAKYLADSILGSSGDELEKIAVKNAAGKDLSAEEKNILGRFEVALDARIDAALALAERVYINSIRFAAFFVAIVLALVTAAFLDPTPDNFFTALVAGIVAVPLAPIAKDVAKAIQSATSAIGSRK